MEKLQQQSTLGKYNVCEGKTSILITVVYEKYQGKDLPISDPLSCQ